jgi:hypothetical protein
VFLNAVTDLYLMNANCWAALHGIAHRTCYAEYIESSVSDGPTCVEMTCPQYQCPLRIPSAAVQDLCESSMGGGGDDLPPPAMERTATGSLVPLGSKVYESYIKHLVKNFIEQSSCMRW